MQILGPHSRPNKSEFLRVGPSNLFLQAFRITDAPSSMRAATLDRTVKYKLLHDFEEKSQEHSSYWVSCMVLSAVYI